ncbi:ATP synthase subunit E [Delitschia confertaspora ATCC 74209]|uniref:ATP synthase F(0) complex subunit e, mitochondrial n=1 Tax=Delitschia confertaspora ATCC 74209 TaxID=1513339 RepID=A0A9P4JL31_9PLEO|nr:ATP synthase subunit E [Delitschia confertaspora ATCC 74209]
MSTSVGVNVLRWSALGLGVFYGIYHQASISARDRMESAKAEYKHKEDLISQARAEWAKQHPEPKQDKKSGGIFSPLHLPQFHGEVRKGNAVKEREWNDIGSDGIAS